MDDDKKDMKSAFPGGFIWFILAGLVLVMMMQNFMEQKLAPVSFSYQLEGLVNLDLIQPEDSRKTANKDNLATFSGKFRERTTDEGKRRFKFLDLLDTNHNLTTEQQSVQQDLSTLHGKIEEAADWFLHLSGMSIPAGGYVVIDDLYRDTDFTHGVEVETLSKKQIESVPELERQLGALSTSSSERDVKTFGRALAEMVRNFRAPTLGIGNEGMKQTLRTLDKKIYEVNNSDFPTTRRLTVYRDVINELKEVTGDLNQVVAHARLSKLRSVRNYKIAVDEYNQLSARLEDNVAQLDKARQDVRDVIWFFNNQEMSTKGLEKQDVEIYHQWFLTSKEEWTNFTKNRGAIFKAPDQPLNAVLEKKFKSEEPPANYFNYLFTLLPVLLVVAVLYFLFSRQMKGMGNSAMNFGKSPAKLMTKDKNKVTFKDVAGADEAIEELQEIVEFLRDPHKFTALGGHIPKGVLCVGAPGTGKTLIARAVAGEADRPFFSISGSDFVEMFVGVGASRIRDMFDQAKKSAPCIIFMDEIDAVGRHRGSGIGGGHDEREQTLNQLLVEMDGFDTNDGVILMAATNRPDVLDKALLRPGRFDRRVIISLPDIKGRFEILKVHAKKIKMDPSVDLNKIAKATPGSSGADLANILNEAALLAARRGRTAVTELETQEARDKVLFGKERRSLELDENEKMTTAYHESGHTVVGMVVEHGDPIDKVTIIPRGMSLGSTQFLPEKTRHSYWRKELVDQLAVLMGGRCAEEIFVNDVSSGAKQDIEQATHIARSMVCEWGMSDELGTVAYDERSESGQYLGMAGYHEKKYSEETARTIDAEVRRLLDEANAKAKKIIEEKRSQVELMTQMLLEFETLSHEDIDEIMEERFDPEKKRERLKSAEEKHMKEEPLPPPPPKEEEGPAQNPHRDQSPPVPNDLRA